MMMYKQISECNYVHTRRRWIMIHPHKSSCFPKKYLHLVLDGDISMGKARLPDVNGSSSMIPLQRYQHYL